MVGRRVKPVRINNEWITSTYKNFPIERVLRNEIKNKKNKKSN
tara:strand:- start:1123 stop:1251 length:129 start_codon:yes stop_codon:yes gene_type:complete